jgi:hypothetical protein
MDSRLSFDAELRVMNERVNLLEALHGKPALATLTSFSGGFFTGKPQTRDHSSFFGIAPKQPGQDRKALKLRFQYTEAGYVLSVKNTGEHYKKFVSKVWLNVFGVTHSNPERPAPFSLIDHNNNTLTRDNIKMTHTPITLMTPNNRYVGRLTARGSPYIYLGETKENAKITFILSVLKPTPS